MLAGLSSYSNANITGQLDVRITIGTGCSIVNIGASGSFNQFGTLDFGVKSSLAAASDGQSTAAGGAGVLQIVCTVGQPYQITLDGGLNASPATQRRMQNQNTGASSNYIIYNLYQEAAHTNSYIPGTAVSRTATGLPQPLIIYGQVPIVTPTPATGTYTDSVNVLITF